MKRTIPPYGVLTLSLAVVLLATTASTASAQAVPQPVLSTWYCPPPSPPLTTWKQYKDLLATGCLGGPGFNFGDRQVGTASPVQLFALGVGCPPPGVEYPCPATFNPRITVSGDYAQTNNCPATLSAGPGQVQGCLIDVTFTPTGTGPKSGTLSTGPGGPTASLTGNGVTHATPPAFALKFDVYVGYTPGLPEGRALLKKRLTLYAITNYDSRVVARGGVKRTVARVAGSGPPKWKSTRFKAKLKHLRRLKESRTKPKVRIKFTATDEFGQRATDELEVRLCREARQGSCVR